MTVKKPPLSERKAKWAKNRDVTLRGKRLNYNASIQAWYKRELQKLVNTMTSDVKKEVTKLFERLPVTPMGTIDESIGSQARILMNKLVEKFQSLFDLESKNLADFMLKRTLKSSESNLKASLKELSGGLTIKTNIVPPELTDAVTASIAENVALIKSIPQQYFKDITGAVMRSITSGEGMFELLPQVNKYGRLTARRAELLALDQTRKAYTTVNAIKLNKLGVKKFEWIHSGGGQTPRESHIKMDGLTFSFENLQEEQAKLGIPKEDRGLPGYPVNCFIGSTQVSLTNGCVNVWRYEHTGDVITLEVQGSSVTSTINHPILTQRGWLAANEIQEGDYLVSGVLNNLNLIENEKTHNMTTFEDLFNTIEGERSLEFSKTFNFHGDIPEKEVDAVRTDRLLPRGIELFSDQQVENFIFALTNIVRMPSGFGFHPQIFSFGCSCGFRQGRSLLLSELAHTDSICFACIAKNNPVFQENSIDDLTTSTPIFSQLKGASPQVITITDILGMGVNENLFSSNGMDVIKTLFKSGSESMAADFMRFTEFFKTHAGVKRFLRVNKKSVSVFSGHVYTLQSEAGWYSVTPAEVLSKNCRCTFSPVIEFDYDESD